VGEIVQNICNAVYTYAKLECLPKVNTTTSAILEFFQVQKRADMSEALYVASQSR